MGLFADIIKKVNSDTRLVPDLMKSEKGNNFRAVSESAVLEVINPILEEFGVYYTTTIKDKNLTIKEAYGSKGKKLQFIADLTIGLTFYHNEEILAYTESVGMGIDDNDKAMGKAFTYAVKYGLFKTFRLRYSDDPDFKNSEPLLVDKPKEQKEEKKENKKPEHKEIAMTENQRDYILGMMRKKGITSQTIIAKFDGCDPEEDEYIPMKLARAIIKWLEGQEDLPF